MNQTAIQVDATTQQADFQPSLSYAEAAHQTGEAGMKSPAWKTHKVHSNFSSVPITHAAPPIVQPKLKIGAVNSPLEDEADRVAEQVVSMPEPTGRSRANVSRQPQPAIQRMCSECQKEKFDDEEDEVFRKEASPGNSFDVPASANINTTGGQPLPATTRQFFEPRFGQDFSNVRIHTDGQSAQSAKQIHAKAYTVGNHITFGQGEFNPGSESGQKLIAHELTHTVQQGEADISPNVTNRITGHSSEPSIVQRSEKQSASDLEDEGDWLREDRVARNARWRHACEYNLLNLRSSEYTQIEERRDFYRWFYDETAAKGYQTRWALAAYIVASGMAELAAVDYSESVAPVTNELQGLARIGNQVIFDDVLPKLRELWRNGPLVGRSALEADMRILAEEQTLVQSMYSSLSSDTIERFQQIADNSYYRTRFARWSGMGGHVDRGPYNHSGDVPSFSGSSGLVSGGDINKPNDRWEYGMALGAHFSTLPSYGTPGAMPNVDAKYSSGAEYRRLNVRGNLHMIDARLNDANVPESEVVGYLKKLSALEQRELIADPSRITKLVDALDFSEMNNGIGLLSNISLEQKLTIFGRITSYSSIDYSDIQPSVLMASPTERTALHTSDWKNRFIDICDDTTIVTATTDLMLPPAMKRDWIDSEQSIF